MSTSSNARPLAGAARRRSEASTQELPDYCARPMCRSPFTRVVGPGRPQAFCSEVCRRAAEKLRIDIAAFGRGGLSPAADTAATEPATWQAAAAAVHRVSGVLAFVGDNDEPLAEELRALHAAVSPVIVDHTT